MEAIQIQNLKCHGCAHTITKELSGLEGVGEVIVDVAEDTVRFSVDKAEVLNEVRLLLAKLGYPEAGSKNSTISKAKSYVSCAVGRFGNS